MARKRIAPVHPGFLLAEDLAEMGISINRLARDTRMSLSRTSDLVHAKRAITAETALRLGRFFGTSPDYWMNLQAHYDLEIAKDKLAETIEKEVLPYPASAA